MQAIADGEMKAFLVKTVRRGHEFVTWMPQGDSWAVTWLIRDEVAGLWETAVDIAPLGELHRMYLTDRGEVVLKEMERVLAARGRGK
ncbi:hypothetical protein [Amycolatopsis sp. NPDC021455]|uniref:hypothetical protein n=1 Tax=Amycolatopsis sp. NPDC021455 TaxID=3154901 RepID=UPI0033ECB84D